MLLLENTTIREYDKISLKSGNQTLKGVVLNSGEGTSTPEDDEFYWLHAPSKGVQYSNPSEIHTRFLFIRIDNADTPFSRIPESVMVRKDDHESWFNCKVTALIGLRKSENGYLVYLEFEER
jgi:hypothetical protein